MLPCCCDTNQDSTLGLWPIHSSTSLWFRAGVLDTLFSPFLVIFPSLNLWHDYVVFQSHDSVNEIQEIATLCMLQLQDKSFWFFFFHNVTKLIQGSYHPIKVPFTNTDQHWICTEVRSDTTTAEGTHWVVECCVPFAFSSQLFKVVQSVSSPVLLGVKLQNWEWPKSRRLTSRRGKLCPTPKRRRHLSWPRKKKVNVSLHLKGWPYLS